MKSKICIFGLSAMFYFFSTIMTAQATSFLIYDEYGGTWYDADKLDDDEDSLMCWAASASNLLYYTGWGQDLGFADEDAIFQYYQDYWTNDGGNVLYGLDWWFNGVNRDENDFYMRVLEYSYIDYPDREEATSSGSFWTDEDMWDYYVYYTDDYYLYDNAYCEYDDDDWFNSLFYIDTLLTDGYGVSLSLTASDLGHAVTVWGYEYDDDGNYLGIYITDSDDLYDGPKYYDVLFDDGYWYLQDFYGYDTYYIVAVQGLAIMDDLYATPEPGTFILFGMGLIFLLSGKRKSRIPG